MQTGATPIEKPSTSETAEQQSSSTTTTSASIPDQKSSIDATAPGEISQPTKGSAEEAAEKLYEERIEEEYAKREGGA